MNGVLHNPLNGRSAVAGLMPCSSYDVARPQKDSNHWCSTENSRTNARNVNFSSGNSNNNNKYNTNNVSRPVVAHDGYGVPDFFLSSVWEAYHDCLRGKMQSKQALEYLPDSPTDIPRIAHELWSMTYKPGTSTCFLVKYPKLREVFAASFRDRIVHHWICLRINPLFEERFRQQGDVSFNCRKGYGTDVAVRYVSEGMRRVSDNYRKETWVFRGDLVGFFMNIDKGLLWYLLERFINRRYFRTDKKYLLHATKAVVMHSPEQDCVLNSPPQWWGGLAPNKSLFTSPTGEPIGNLTTQLFANFLLSYFDQYVKWVYRGKSYCYARFVDDFLLICDDKRFLIDSIPSLETFLREKLRLELHKDKRYLQPASHGVMFVGTFIKPGRLYLSNRTIARFEERCEGFGKLMEEKDELTILDCCRIEQVVNSYLGFCKGRRTYSIRKNAIDMMGRKMYKYFYVRGHYDSIRSRKKYRTIKD